MKRETAAWVLLLLLIGGAWWNIRSVDRLTDSILRSLDKSQAAALRGETETACAAMDEALQTWLKADSYTHIFIRHSEIDSTADAFYELQEQLISGAGEGGSRAAYDRLRYHLDSIRQMEHLSLGSIF